ncbi:MAG: prepilin-type N-terminal cleavage/methylation domain-containing protein [Phycisphaerales bacterium]|nr:MAG: prepilin-type N-terminal cleavage/methylation domain-containing protein [Phycisphaerales bacterium]
MTEPRRHIPRAAPRRNAFTLVELLVVVVIMLIVIGIVVVAGATIVAESRRASTERLMGAVANALEMFRADHGYYPPLLSHNNGNLHVPEAQPNAFDSFTAGPLADARFHSVYSLAAYLVGVGDLAGEGAGGGEYTEVDGVPGPGLRSPGIDRAWGGAIDGLQSAQPPTTGRTFGPYIDVAAGRNMRQVRRGDVTSFAPISPIPEQNVRFTIVDRWGTPIRYYRYWPTREGDNASLANAPLELFSSDTVITLAPAYSSSPNASLTPEQLGRDRVLFDAPYALLSAGPDTLFGSGPDEPPASGSQQYIRLRDAGQYFPAQASPGDTAAEAGERLRRRLTDNIRVTP